MSAAPKSLVEALYRRGGKLLGGILLFNCPRHVADNPSARYDLDQAVWCCDVCNAGADWVELCIRLDIDFG